MTDHTSLIARLESAGEGSRELDQAVWLACGLERMITGPVNHGVGVWNGPHVSYSLDDALALASRVLPDAFVGIQQNRGVEPGEAWSAFLSVPWPGFHESDAANPALALSAAILKALSPAGEAR